MARGFTIKESDIYRLVIEELNNNAFSSKIQFSLADWLTSTDSDGSIKGLLISRLALNGNGRFDVQDTFDDEDYSKTSNSFVACSIGSLNGEIMALNTIKDVVYDTMIEFLVCADNINVQQAVTLAIEEVRARFIQYQRTLEVSYTNIDNLSSATRVSEVLKVIMMSGTIDYGSFVQINGKQYLTYTLPITIQVTNFGEFANQQKIYLGVDSILTGAVPTMFLLEPNEWHYGTASSVESAMLLPEKSSSTQQNNKEVKSITKDKGFAFTMEIQMDLQNATVGQLLKVIYKSSLLEELTQPVYTVKIETYLYNTSTKLYAIDSSLTMTRKMILTQNGPSESLSKGEKITYSLGFVPYYVSVV